MKNKHAKFNQFMKHTMSTSYSLLVGYIMYILLFLFFPFRRASHFNATILLQEQACFFSAYPTCFNNISSCKYPILYILFIKCHAKQYSVLQIANKYETTFF